jgi:hypothetical protein
MVVSPVGVVRLPDHGARRGFGKDTTRATNLSSLK